MVNIYIEKEVIKIIKTDKQEIMKNISAFLVFGRQQKYGLSQPEISKQTGISQNQLSLYENGKAIPSLLAAIALADMFDISLDYLVGRCSNSKSHKTIKEFKYRED